LLAGIGLPITMPVLVIAGVVAALVGTFTGKKVLSMLVPGDRAEKFRSQFIEAMRKEYDNLERDSKFDEKVREQIEVSFAALKSRINTETEHILNDTQATLDELKIKLAQSEVMAEKEQQDLIDMSESITEIAKKANQINQQLVAILNR
jgi:septal ring factor EnvC (AmiA/AmiB activator)